MDEKRRILDLFRSTATGRQSAMAGHGHQHKRQRRTKGESTTAGRTVKAGLQRIGRRPATFFIRFLQDANSLISRSEKSCHLSPLGSSRAMRIKRKLVLFLASLQLRFASAYTNQGSRPPQTVSKPSFGASRPLAAPFPNGCCNGRVIT